MNSEEESDSSHKTIEEEVKGQRGSHIYPSLFGKENGAVKVQRSMAHSSFSIIYKKICTGGYSLLAFLVLFIGLN